MNLKVQLLTSDAKMPTKGHPGDAGIDFYSTETHMFAPHQQIHVHTGVSMEIPDGYAGLIWDKSSVSFNQGLKVMGGVIDAGYRGEIIVSMYNTTSTEQVITKGNKVAQMLIQKFEKCDIVVAEELSDTVRGTGREGSTGK